LQKFSFSQVIFLSKFFSQFSALAINLAIVVLPTPLIPVNKYELGVLLFLIPLIIVSEITS
tara:strand:+ start:969 stop:1151 length:183 start_codon:yes stop_codon:yes gene_type:complete